MPDQFIYTCDDVLHMLDAFLESRDGKRVHVVGRVLRGGLAAAPVLHPAARREPAEWFSDGLIAPGRVLELGCGQGRNAIYLAGRGYSVDAVDFSPEAITQAGTGPSRPGAG